MSFDKYLSDWVAKAPFDSNQSSLSGYPFELLTDEYINFVVQKNGGEGFIGESYLILWSLEELVPFNEQYQVSTYIPGLCFIGSNGAGEGFAYDLRPSSKRNIVMVPFVGMNWNDALIVGADMDDFFKRLYEGSLYE